MHAINLSQLTEENDRITEIGTAIDQNIAIFYR